MHQNVIGACSKYFQAVGRNKATLLRALLFLNDQCLRQGRLSRQSYLAVLLDAANAVVAVPMAKHNI